MMYVKYPLSLRNVEDLLAERGIDICHETLRFWWNRFGPMFAAEIRNKAAALKFLKKMMKRHGKSKVIVTDRLRSYGAAMKEIGSADVQETGRWLNNRAENSHQPFRRRERAMLRFRRMHTIQKFSSIHASVHKLVNQERHLVSRYIYKERRSAALAEWQAVMG
jgi:putative transposase